MTEEAELVYHKLPRHWFPVKLEILRTDNDEVVYEETVEAPETITMLHIPPLGRELGVPVWVRVTYGDGKVVESKDGGTTADQAEG